MICNLYSQDLATLAVVTSFSRVIATGWIIQDSKVFKNKKMIEIIGNMNTQKKKKKYGLNHRYLDRCLFVCFPECMRNRDMDSFKQFASRKECPL